MHFYTVAASVCATAAIAAIKLLHVSDGERNLAKVNDTMPDRQNAQ